MGSDETKNKNDRWGTVQVQLMKLYAVIDCGRVNSSINTIIIRLMK